MVEETLSVRVDKWLWAARFYKSRSLATEAIELGRVQVEGVRVKPARLLKIGEKVVIQRGNDRLEVFVRLLSDVRRSAPLAQLLYDETLESQTSRLEAQERRKLFSEPATGILKGRPTKRDRRQIERFVYED